MKRRVSSWILATVAVLVAVAATWSCSSTPSAAGLAAGCSINSDCNSPLVCVFGLCHEQCAESRDCPDGERCIAVGADKVCQLAKENQCDTATPCGSGLVCVASQCRNSCSPIDACAVSGQVCSSFACFEPNELPDAAADTGVVDTGADTSADTGADTGADAVVDAACVPEAGDAGTLGYVPSNFNPDTLAVADAGVPDGAVMGAAIDWANAPAVTVSANCGFANGVLACLPAPIPVTMGDGSPALLFAMRSLTVQSSVTLSLVAENESTVGHPAIIFAVLTTVDVQGTIDASSDFDKPGPGAYGSPAGFTPQGPGGGGNGFTVNYPNSAPSGGSFCGIGGRGGFTMAPEAPAGAMYGNARIVPLLAGSGGGNYAGEHFGAGGGALQISAGQSITVRGVGVIAAGGGGGGGGGGNPRSAAGSGGAILLEAPTVTIVGILAANGGSGATGDINSTQCFKGANATPNNVPTPGPMYVGVSGGAGSAAAMINGAAGGQSVPDAAAPSWGSGGGGAGWIRVNTFCSSATIGASAIFSPDLTTICASQGAIGH